MLRTVAVVPSDVRDKDAVPSGEGSVTAERLEEAKTRLRAVMYVHLRHRSQGRACVLAV